MQNLLSNYQAVVGVFLPLLIAVFVKEEWRRELKIMVSFAFVVAAAFGEAVYSGAWQIGNLGASVLAIMVLTITTYKGFWLGTGITDFIEKKVKLPSAGDKTSMIAYLLVVVWLPGLTGLTGCATTNLNLSHEQGFLWASNVYTAQYDLYLDRALRKDLPIETRIAVKKDPALIKQDMIRTDLSDKQKQLLRDRKKLLSFVHQPLLAWGDYVRTGVLSPQYTDIAEIEAIVTKAVNDLLKTEGEQW